MCIIEATKVATGAESQEFLFTGFAGGEPIPPFTLVDGQFTGGFIPDGITVVITETPQPGWIYGGIESEGDGGLVVTNLENGFSLECINPELGSATCVIRNIQVVSSIPTLSEWGLIILAGILGMFVLVTIARKKYWHKKELQKGELRLPILY